MTTMRHLATLTLVLAACSSPTNEVLDSSVSDDGNIGALDGALDARDPDSGIDAADAGPVDAGTDVFTSDSGRDSGPDASVPDPCTCEPGELDGCCPLEAAFGALDPDCVRLECGEATWSEPVSLWSREQSGSVSTPALAVRCDDLAVVFSDFSNSTGRFTFFQTRDRSGAVVVPLEGAVAPERFRFNGALAFSPSDDSFLYASHILSGPARAVRLDAMGIPESRVETINAACNGFAEAIATFDVGDGYVVAQTGKGCASGSFTSGILHLAYDGTPTGRRVVVSESGTRNGTSFSYDAPTQLLSVVYQSDSRIRIRRLHTDTFEFDDVIALGGVSPLVELNAFSVASRAEIVLVTHDLVRPNGAIRGPSVLRYGTYSDSDGRYRESPEAAPGPSDKRIVQRRLIAHPGGFTQATTWVDIPRRGAGPSITNPEVWLTRFSLEGVLLSSERLDPDFQSAFPDLAYFDGRVAVSWVRNAGLQEPMLSFLSCD